MQVKCSKRQEDFRGAISKGLPDQAETALPSLTGRYPFLPEIEGSFIM